VIGVPRDPVVCRHAGMEIFVTAGPDAGRAIRLGPGRHLVGRARGAAVSLADPAVEAHHAALDVGLDGTLVVTQLAGRIALTADGRPHETGRVRAGAVVEIGATRLELGRRTAGPIAHGDRWATLAAVERECYLARGRAPWVVTLGVGRVHLPLPLDVAVLPLSEQAAAAGAEIHDDVPVLADLAASRVRVLAVRGPHARQAIAAIVEQLPGRQSGGRAWVVAADPRPWLSGDRPVTVLVPAEPGAALPDGCDSVLELGAGWRATFVPDLANPTLTPIRFHARGRPWAASDEGALGELAYADTEQPVVTPPCHRADQPGDGRQATSVRAQVRHEPQRRAGAGASELDPCRAAQVARQVGHHDGRRGHRSQVDREAERVRQGGLHGAPPHIAGGQSGGLEAPQPRPPPPVRRGVGERGPHVVRRGGKLPRAVGRDVRPCVHPVPGPGRSSERR